MAGPLLIKGGMPVGFVIFLAKRVALMVASLIVIIAVSYTLMYYAPGNYFDIQRTQTNLSAQYGVDSPEFQKMKQLFEERYGLDKPLHVQIWTYVKRSFTFNFGPSFQNPTVMIETLVAERLPRTLLVVVIGLGLALVVGIPLGIIAAFRRNTWVDYIVTGISMIGQVIPSYVLAVALMLIVGNIWSVSLGGWSPEGAGLKELWAPVVVLGLGPMAGIARFMRNQVAETLGQEFIRTARSKGVPERWVIIRHTLRNSLIPVVTITAPQLGHLLIGAVWIEAMFRIPGIGQMFAAANGARDYPAMVTGTVILALGVMLANLLADILYAMLDPRIKLEA